MFNEIIKCVMNNGSKIALLLFYFDFKFFYFCLTVLDLLGSNAIIVQIYSPIVSFIELTVYIVQYENSYLSLMILIIIICDNGASY